MAAVMGRPMTAGSHGGWAHEASGCARATDTQTHRQINGWPVHELRAWVGVLCGCYVLGASTRAGARGTPSATETCHAEPDQIDQPPHPHTHTHSHCRHPCLSLCLSHLHSVLCVHTEAREQRHSLEDGRVGQPETGRTCRWDELVSHREARGQIGAPPTFSHPPQPQPHTPTHTYIHMTSITHISLGAPASRLGWKILLSPLLCLWPLTADVEGVVSELVCFSWMK